MPDLLAAYPTALGHAGIAHEWHEEPGGHFVRPHLPAADIDGMIAHLRKA